MTKFYPAAIGQKKKLIKGFNRIYVDIKYEHHENYICNGDKIRHIVLGGD
jgi:hypothetical protein